MSDRTNSKGRAQADQNDLGERNREGGSDKSFESASDRAHGTHGWGGSRETRLDDANVEPGNQQKTAAGDDNRLANPNAHTSDAAMGSSASGGSVIDKR